MHKNSRRRYENRSPSPPSTVELPDFVKTARVKYEFVLSFDVLILFDDLKRPSLLRTVIIILRRTVFFKFFFYCQKGKALIFFLWHVHGPSGLTDRRRCWTRVAEGVANRKMLRTTSCKVSVSWYWQKKCQENAYCNVVLSRKFLRQSFSSAIGTN